MKARVSTGDARVSTGGARVQIIEDEPALAQVVIVNLESEGYAVRHAVSGLQGLESVLEWNPEIILLDVMLPRMDGFEVCRRLRESGNITPVLFITARGEEDDRIRGLELGGDDYLVKPFSVDELLARVRGMLRRQAWYQGSVSASRSLRFGDNHVDFAAYSARTVRGPIALTQKECHVLKLLAERTGQTVTRTEILERVWGYDRFPSTRTVDNVIMRLRRHFEPNPHDPRHFHSTYGAGYRFDPGEGAEGGRQKPEGGRREGVS